jgi:hypothetical protein
MATPPLWHLTPSLLSREQKIHEAVAKLLLVPNHALSRVIPLVREQTYQYTLSFFFFHVSWTLPDGCISRRNYVPLPPGPGPRFPVRAAREFFYHIHLSRLALQPIGHPGDHYLRKYYWNVLAPSEPVHLDKPSTPLGSPIRLEFFDCLRQGIAFFVEEGVTPVHMSSDEGLDHADELSHPLFDKYEMLVKALRPASWYHPSLSLLTVLPALLIIILGIKLLPNINAFIGELIGGLVMVYLRSSSTKL